MQIFIRKINGTSVSLDVPDLDKLTYEEFRNIIDRHTDLGERYKIICGGDAISNENFNDKKKIIPHIATIYAVEHTVKIDDVLMILDLIYKSREKRCSGKIPPGELEPIKDFDNHLLLTIFNYVSKDCPTLPTVPKEDGSHIKSKKRTKKRTKKENKEEQCPIT